MTQTVQATLSHVYSRSDHALFESNVNYHLVLTRECNLNCSYCRGGENIGATPDVQYSMDDLANFLERDPDPQLMLYGGEPTLRIPLLTSLMDRFPRSRFMLQTNGLLLHRIPEEYVRRFHSILVSIDGPETLTDHYRSRGVYRRVLENVRWLESIGYPGDKVARMAVSQETDIYEAVRHLLDLRDPTFDHVHWQLNVVWSAEGNWTDFPRWLQDSYKPRLEQLVHAWVTKMQEGVVEGIVPFLPLMYSLLTGRSSRLRCGSGIDTFVVHTDGTIGVCPISPDWEFSLVGDIWSTDPASLANVMTVDEPCPSCDHFWVCGGRCLFANKERLWGQEGFDRICTSVKHLVGCLEKEVPVVHGFIEAGTISIEEFNYPEHNNGCEIIP
ncbi:MAG: TIGR04084 family radical SAM/SPASM domain-containing protein [Candidatus Thorarchaeota archaeon]|nr:TIGR04084 family radical SAM/SPASM domain-containing protein [Candidatus Thorarchaeota archaeon]